jgi:glutathione S-transferase
MALKLADISVEVREISLRDKPAHMLKISPKGTVPVLQLIDGRVLAESLDIMRFALEMHDVGANVKEACISLIEENDGYFKRVLDAYKYPERHPNRTQLEYRSDGELFLQKLEKLLTNQTYLFGKEPGLADIAIFPFIRQFVAVDADWFANALYPKLRNWLNFWLASDLFDSIMEKQPTYHE